jgi:pectin methylesterase-like acyl-CoA thioesterase
VLLQGTGDDKHDKNRLHLDLRTAVVVTAAIKLRPSSGSSQSAAAGTAIRPSAEYG